MIENSEKQAYLVMAHNNVEQLNFLIDNLDSEYGDIFLHIDAKSNILKRDITVPQKSKLIMCPPMRVFWADYSQVECEIELIRIATQGQYKYYHLISGSDFPLMCQKDIYQYFKDKDGLYLHFTTPENLMLTRSYIKYYHLFQKNLCIVNRDKSFSIYKVINKLLLNFQKLLRINRVDKSFEIKKGANWFSIPHDFADYVLKNEAFVKTHFSYTRSPDEFFLQTLAYNSYFRERIYHFAEDDSYVACLRYIDWKRGKPYVFRTQDFEELKHTGMIFARKFDFSIDKTIVKQLASCKNGKRFIAY
jgi:hypothetical protein